MPGLSARLHIFPGRAIIQTRGGGRERASLVFLWSNSAIPPFSSDASELLFGQAALAGLCAAWPRPVRVMRRQGSR